MQLSGRKKTIAFFITLGALLVVFAVALDVGWILLNWRKLAFLILGIFFFIAIIAGLVLNTIFLVREIRRNEQHNSFINAVTHELKTPIASIQLYLETLQSRDVDPAKRREFYNIMLDDSKRLLHTVEQVLQAGQAGQRGRRLTRETIDLSRVTIDCVELARKRYNLPEEALAYAGPTGPGIAPSVMGDPHELRTAISNLIDNAVKYSGQEVKVTIEVARLDSKWAVVRVSDRGIGIPKSHLNRVFKRFYRVPGRVMLRVRGTGLGLFIVRSIVEQHGGRAFAESAGEGWGSTFTIQLPCA